MSDRLELYPLSMKRLREVLASAEELPEAQSYWEDYLWDGDSFVSEDEAPDELWERLRGELSEALGGGPAPSGEAAYAIASAAFGVRAGERTVAGLKAEGVDEGVRLAAKDLDHGTLLPSMGQGGTLGLALGPAREGVIADGERLALGCLGAAEVASLAARLGARELTAEEFVSFGSEATVRDAIFDALLIAAKEKLDLFVVRRNG